MQTLRPVDGHIQNYLDSYINQIETILEADVLTIFSSMWPALVDIVKNAVESFPNRKNRIAIILDTTGGAVEVVERMVHIIRSHYYEVYFLVPDRAMSAGTIFVMAGDQIFMDYSSCLGSIDPQIEKDGKYVPALAYLDQYLQLYEKAQSQQLNTAEVVLLNNLDPGELHMFELASKLSKILITTWLSKFKFSDWVDSSGNPVSEEKKKIRAGEIADELSDYKKWGSHGRMISKTTLTNPEGKIQLKIKDIGEHPELSKALNPYVGLVKDYIQIGQLGMFVHTKNYRDYRDYV